jgi:hypothetical protein
LKLKTAMKRTGFLLGAAFLAATCMASAAALAGSPDALAPEWRITRVVGAPWAPGESIRLPLQGWVGKAVSFKADSVEGPGVLRCGHAVRETTNFPAESLFQGNLPAPAEQAAQALGIAHLPVTGVSVSCDSGIFEFHHVDAENLLLALDNQILTLSHSPGTLASAASPEGRVQRLLEAHFGGDMGFMPANLKGQRIWFSQTLNEAVSRYFDRPTSADEVPAIDGDPFTDSQEYPQRFTVGTARVSDGKADVPVRLSDAFRERSVIYVMRHEGGSWHLDDLRLASDETLRGLLD